MAYFSLSYITAETKYLTEKGEKREKEKKKKKKNMERENESKRK
jgi:hypothetical protein